MVKELSIHKTIHGIFLDNPDKVYTSRDLINAFNQRGERKMNDFIISTILVRLLRKGLILRTKTQLATGYHYSMKNRLELNRIHLQHLLPYDFENKSELIEQIRRNEFGDVKNNIILDLNQIKKLDFVQKYSLNYFQSNKIQEFLAMLVGFSMCDGHVNKKRTRSHFFFRRKSDAELFAKDFQKMFNQENFFIKKNTNGDSYVAEAVKGSIFAKLLARVGVPTGNKVFQPFLVPDWIYHGSEEIKKIFLSTVIGNEGSAPSNNKWRIQFVLSKCKEHVPNLLEFLNQIRAMLLYFGITTSHIQLRKQKGRQFHGRFYIKGKENLHKFYNEFSFLYASEKQEILEKLIFNDLS
jgi:predicted transcriptional regulator